MINTQEDNIEFGLLENGLDFMQSAINYLIRSENKSDIKYGLLHLASGVELIFKYRLFLDDWKLIFQNLKKANKEDFKAGNFQSVNFNTCLERLEDNSGITFDDEEKDTLKQLRYKRNKIEHFSLTDSKNAIISYLNQILSITLDFIEKEIPKESLTGEDKELIGFIRNEISELDEFVYYRLNQIDDELKCFSELITPVTCPSCFQSTLITDDGSNCLFCGYTDEANQVADRFIEDVLQISKYEEITNGGEYPQYNCPECGNDALVYISDDDLWKCFKCGYEGDQHSIDYCETCGTPYQKDDLTDVGMCDACIDYRMGE